MLELSMDVMLCICNVTDLEVLEDFIWLYICYSCKHDKLNHFVNRWIISKGKITCLAVMELPQEIWITCWPITFPCILWMASSADTLQTKAMEAVKKPINNKIKKEKKLRLMKDLIRCRVTWHQATWNLLPWKRGSNSQNHIIYPLSFKILE